MLKFEKLTSEDSLKLTDLLHSAYKSDEKIGIHFKAANINSEKVEKHLESTPTFGYKDENGCLVSTVSVRLPWSLDTSPYFLPHIGWLATNPKYKNQGYAKQIINDVITKFIIEKLKAPAVTLGTAVEHPWLKSLYISQGFRPFKEIQKYNDHKTVYLINIFNYDDLKNISDKQLRMLIRKEND